MENKACLLLCLIHAPNFFYLINSKPRPPFNWVINEGCTLGRSHATDWHINFFSFPSSSLSFSFSILLKCHSVVNVGAPLKSPNPSLLIPQHVLLSITVVCLTLLHSKPNNLLRAPHHHCHLSTPDRSTLAKVLSLLRLPWQAHQPTTFRKN